MKRKFGLGGRNIFWEVETQTKMADVTSQQIQQDWENREFIEILSESIKNIAKFLNNFGKCSLLGLFDVCGRGM